MKTKNEIYLKRRENLRNTIKDLELQVIKDRLEFSRREHEIQMLRNTLADLAVEYHKILREEP